MNNCEFHTICEKCGYPEIKDKKSVRDERSEESAEPKYISRIDPDGVRRIYDSEGRVLDPEAVRERSESAAIVAERTRIIKALEGLKGYKRDYSKEWHIGFEDAIDQAINLITNPKD